MIQIKTVGKNWHNNQNLCLLFEEMICRNFCLLVYQVQSWRICNKESEVLKDGNALLKCRQRQSKACATIIECFESSCVILQGSAMHIGSTWGLAVYDFFRLGKSCIPFKKALKYDSQISFES